MLAAPESALCHSPALLPFFCALACGKVVTVNWAHMCRTPLQSIMISTCSAVEISAGGHADSRGAACSRVSHDRGDPDGAVGARDPDDARDLDEARDPDDARDPVGACNLVGARDSTGTAITVAGTVIPVGTGGPTAVAYEPASTGIAGVCGCGAGSPIAVAASPSAVKASPRAGSGTSNAAAVAGSPASGGGIGSSGSSLPPDVAMYVAAYAQAANNAVATALDNGTLHRDYALMLCEGKAHAVGGAWPVSLFRASHLGEFGAGPGFAPCVVAISGEAINAHGRKPPPGHVGVVSEAFAKARQEELAAGIETALKPWLETYVGCIVSSLRAVP